MTVGPFLIPSSDGRNAPAYGSTGPGEDLHAHPAQRLIRSFETRAQVPEVRPQGWPDQDHHPDADPRRAAGALAVCARMGAPAHLECSELGYE